MIFVYHDDFPFLPTIKLSRFSLFSSFASATLEAMDSVSINVIETYKF